MPEALTDRQAEILAFLRERCAAGLPPTVREIGQHFGFRSLNGAYGHLRALVRKGCITITSSQSRSIRIVGQEPLSRERIEKASKAFIDKYDRDDSFFLSYENLTDHLCKELL